MILIRTGSEHADPRRRLLIRALALGLPAALASSYAPAQSVFGTRPARLPPNQSIYRLQGSAKVNDVDADQQTQIRSGDTVETGKDSELVFVVGGNSMILRSDSRLVLSGPPQRTEASSLIITGLRLLTGKVLSVSRNRPMRLETSVATIGIRGTGFYVESDPEHPRKTAIRLATPTELSQKLSPRSVGDARVATRKVPPGPQISPGTR